MSRMFYRPNLIQGLQHLLVKKTESFAVDGRWGFQVNLVCTRTCYTCHVHMTNNSGSIVAAVHATGHGWVRGSILAEITIEPRWFC